MSLCLAGTSAVADPAVELPTNPPGLDIEFRCQFIPDGEGPALECPLDEDDTIPLGGPDDIYLQFEALDIECSDSEFTPFVANLFTSGIGVRCDEFFDASGIDEGQQLQISVLKNVEFPARVPVSTSTPMRGIYLNNLEPGEWNGESCDASAAGDVVVSYLDEPEGVPQPDLVIPWTSDNSDNGESCEVNDLHAVFIDFEGSKSVTSVLVNVNFYANESGEGAGPVAAGFEVEAANVNPDCFDGGEGICAIDLVPDPLPGQDLATIIADDDLFGTVSVVDGFPVRVIDPRASCQATPSGVPETLEFNNSNVYTYYLPDAAGPVDSVTDTLPLVVSDDGSTDYLILSAKGCGVPRMEYNSAAVPRGTPGSMPYLDIIAIESDIDPVDSLILFESENEAPYECQPGPVPAPLPLGDALDQPLGEINSRESEVKQLAGVPGVVDPMSRDKTQACGSRRVGSQRFSFIVYSLIHNLQTDMRSELSQEIQVLTDTVNRTADCVNSSFYYGQLAPYPVYINNFYNAGVAEAEVQCDAAQAAFFFGRTRILVDRFRARLQILGSNPFLNCYASGSNLDQIKQSPPAPLAPSDKPLNAWGDLITQLQHLSYSLVTFRNELADPPSSCRPASQGDAE